MAVATWRILAFGTLLGVVALPASAQVVIGGSGQPSVEVNWAVLDSLGRQPTLADMLKGEAPPALQVAPARGKAKSALPQGVQFKPYVPPTVTKAKVSAPKKAVATPAIAKAEPDLAASPIATLVQATQKEVPAAAPPKPHVAGTVEPPAAKTAAATALEGPRVSLPEAPKAVAAPAQKTEAAPAQKTEAAPVQAAPAAVEAVSPTPAVPAAVVPVVTAMADPAPSPAAAPSAVPAPVAVPTALTPPPPASASQVTALPLGPAPVPVISSKGDTLSVVFGSDNANLPGAAQPELDKLVKRLRKDDGLGLQLLAFAEGDDANASKARRLSLSRALEVRKYLMEQGVRSTRIEVRALGNKLEGAGPADRVDAVVVSR